MRRLNFMVWHLRGLVLSVLMLGGASGAWGQEARYSVETNSFLNDWSVGVSGGWMEKTRGPEVGLSVGKWFTPGCGVRLKGELLGGFSGKEDGCLVLAPQVLFNVSNMFMGYAERRVYSLVPFVGGGLFRDCGQDVNRTCFSFGVLNRVRVSDGVSLNVEAGRLLVDQRGHWFVGGGISVRLGSKKGWRKAVDREVIRAEMQAELDALNAQLEDEREENRRLSEELEGLKK